MNDHLVDTPIKLATCNRCGAYVFLAHSSGVRSAADAAPAGRDAYIAAVIAGRRLFDLVEAAGRPQKLMTRTVRSQAPAFDAAGAQIAAQGRRKVLAEHSCGAHAMDATKFTEVEQGPPPVPAMPGERRDGHPQPTVHESGLTVEEIPRRSVARRAISHRSDIRISPRISERPPRCDICNAYIGSDEIYTGAQHGSVWKWAMHEECP